MIVLFVLLRMYIQSYVYYFLIKLKLDNPCAYFHHKLSLNHPQTLSTDPSEFVAIYSSAAFP